LASGFLALGIKPDEKVSIWMTNHPEWIYTQLALAKIGGVLVPVNARFKTYELEYLLTQSDTTTLIFKDRTQTTDYLEMVRVLCPEVNSSQKGELVASKFPLLKRLICFSPKQHEGMFSFQEVMKLGDTVALEEARKARQDSIHPDDILMIQYTSGTTSLPKGATISHDQVIRTYQALAGNQKIESEDKLYCPVPFFHVVGSLMSIILVLIKGATLVTNEYFDSEIALRTIEREQCTAMHGFEPHWLGMFQHPRFGEFNIRSLQKGSAGAPPEIFRKIVEKIGAKKIVSSYGLSEGSGNTGTTRADDPLDFKLQWNAKPHKGIKVKIIDIETGDTLPPGKEGEICIRGFNVMKGYYKMPEETAKAIDKKGWLHTGDSGIMGENKFFKFTGRIKDMLKVGGENVSVLEVEGFLLRHPAIKQVQVIGVPDPRLTEVPLAVVQLKEGAICTEKEIIDFCKGKIARFKIPRYVRFVQEYPMTASGKIQKVKLKETAMREWGLGGK
jgi:fatty-acyl-CoA synthase